MSLPLPLEANTALVPPPRTVVLMSTYNGERFVAEQLRSILEQLPQGGCIRVRDDGSSDGTVAVIESLLEPRISITRGPNLGFARSFLTLLAAAPSDADMVMFADQDDVWLPEKIGRAWRHLQPLDSTPGLYGSAQMLADVGLRPLQATPTWSREPAFAHALAENIITGCTAALNASAVQLVQRAGVPKDLHFHDWWLYLVVSAFGRVVFDPEPTLLYRQHGANQIGHGTGWLGRNLGIVRFLLRRDWVGILLGQVSALWRHYGPDLDPQARRLVIDHFRVEAGGTVIRWRLVFGLKRWRETFANEVAFRLLLAFHKLRLWPPPRRRLRASSA